MIINHNMKAINAHRMMGINASGMGKSIEKLSSGLRINRAADDAAGLYISEKMRSQVRGLKQASRNSQDGISAVQTAEGALDEVHSMLQRMRELAVQGANDPNTEEDRDAIQSEINQLTDEIQSISGKTQFNKQVLLDGNFKDKNLQVGANQDQNLKISIKSMSAEGLGIGQLKNPDVENVKGKSEVEYTAIDSKGSNFKIKVGNLETEEIKLTKDNGGTLDDAVAQINNALLKAGIQAVAKNGTSKIEFESLQEGEAKVQIIGTAGSDKEKGFKVDAGETKDATVKTAGSGDPQATDGEKAVYKAEFAKVAETHNSNFKIVIDGKTVASVSLDSTTGADADKAVAEINKKLKGTGFTAENDGGAHIKFTADQVGRHTFSIYGTTNSTAGEGLKADNGKIVTTVKTEKEGLDKVKDLGQNLSTRSLIDVSSYATSNRSLGMIDKAIASVSKQRSDLGAIQNRLEHTIKNLDNAAENTQAAESRIRDTDMADEMSKFTKANILTQASQAMLAQANQLPQQVLQLLR